MRLVGCAASPGGRSNPRIPVAEPIRKHFPDTPGSVGSIWGGSMVWQFGGPRPRHSIFDLFKKESFEHMHEDIKKIIKFYEEDSEDMVANNIIPDLDLFLVSDHFMHLQYDKADNIIKGILANWKPKHIMLREVKKEYETPHHPRLYHNYDQFLSDYDLVYDGTSKQTNKSNSISYFIWLLKRK